MFLSQSQLQHFTDQKTWEEIYQVEPTPLQVSSDTHLLHKAQDPFSACRQSHVQNNFLSEAFFFHFNIHTQKRLCLQNNTTYNAIQYLCCLQYGTYYLQYITYTIYNILIILRTTVLKCLPYLHAIQNTIYTTVLFVSVIAWMDQGNIEEIICLGDLGE